MVHHPLKERRCIFETEVHDLWDERSVLCFKSRFVLVLLCDSDVVIPPANIKLGEERLVSQILQSLSDVW